jgi:hypothetical protein
LSIKPNSPPATTTLLISWRDDGGAWGQPIEAIIDGNVSAAFRTLGVYRMRQWKIEFTDAAAFTFIGMIEEYEVLDS